ncbi:MAG: hypothetical protein EWM51_10320 [Treponema sp.]|nr:MAG: hypothetical protein BWY39_01024 [Spirochaetes bacterium ADurb.Bin269]TAH49886.1 MAG: hypothetical protein EWM51_10320 [Treponema sp.]
MNIKANLKYISIGSIIFLVLYSFIAVKSLGADIFFEPVWTTDISEPVTDAHSTRSTAEAEAFILGNRFGFFLPDGTVLSSEKTDQKITASTFGWAVYPADAQETVLYRPDGTIRTKISEAGFVHLDQERIYLFQPGGDGVSQFDETGTKLWTREHTAPITAFRSSPKGTIIGYLDGRLVHVKPDGTEVFSFYPGGSNLQVILGAALSDDGTMAACVSGIEKQRFLLIKITGNQHKIVYHAYLDGNLRRQAFVDFEAGGQYAFFESENRLGFVDCSRYTASSIPISGKVIEAGECPGDALFVVLSKNGTTWTLSAVERPDHLVVSTNFTATDAFIIQRNDILYLGTDTHISRLNIRGLK